MHWTNQRLVVVAILGAAFVLTGLTHIVPWIQIDFGLGSMTFHTWGGKITSFGMAESETWFSDGFEENHVEVKALVIIGFLLMVTGGFFSFLSLVTALGGRLSGAAAFGLGASAILTAGSISFIIGLRDIFEAEMGSGPSWTTGYFLNWISLGLVSIGSFVAALRETREPGRTRHDYQPGMLVGTPAGEGKVVGIDPDFVFVRLGPEGDAWRFSPHEVHLILHWQETP